MVYVEIETLVLMGPREAGFQTAGQRSSGVKWGKSTFGSTRSAWSLKAPAAHLPAQTTARMAA